MSVRLIGQYITELAEDYLHNYLHNLHYNYNAYLGWPMYMKNLEETNLPREIKYQIKKKRKNVAANNLFWGEHSFDISLKTCPSWNVTSFDDLWRMMRDHQLYLATAFGR